MAKKITEIIWTNPAKSDLQHIYNFLAEVSEVIAFGIISEILDKIEILKTGFSKIGQKEPLLRHKKKNYRYFISGNYKIIYFEENNVVIIFAVFDARQNPVKLKGKINE